MAKIMLSWPDSCSAEIFDDGSYDLVLPSGEHLRGKPIRGPASLFRDKATRANRRSATAKSQLRSESPY